MTHRDPVAALLDPHSVAVIGASNDPLKRGYQAIRRLQEDGFPHPIHPVNPREHEILGLPVAPTIEDVEGPVDLAFIATPAPLVPEILRACGRKGVAAAVVIAVGFGETGAEGRALEDEAAAVAAEHGIRLVGPNTNGVFNLPRRLNLVGAADVPEGPIALVCQSGNMALSLFTEAAHASSVGFSSYVGIGNEAGLRFHELVDHLAHDPDTQGVLMYAEGFRDGRAFLESAARCTRTTPIVLYKAGRSDAARRSARSHTGAIAGSPRVADALLRQAGVVVVERSDELLPVCEALVRQPPMPGPRVAVLADGGGHATIAADALPRSGLQLAALSDDTRRRLADLLPAAASTANPVDVAGATDRDPALFETCVEVLLDDPGVDGLLCVGLLGGYGIRFSDDLAAAEERAARGMAERAAARGIPLVVQSAYAPAGPPAHALLRAAGVPVHGSVEAAVRCLGALAERGRFLATEVDRSALSIDRPPVTDEASQLLTEPAARELLAGAGLPTDGWVLARDADDAAEAARALGRPVALKVVSPDVVHKSDVGGVLLGLAGPDPVRAGFEQLLAAVAEAAPGARVDGVLVVPMAPPGLELIVGATTDPTFGPLVTVGAGGVTVEALEDATFRAVPVTEVECHEMLDELTISPLLRGFRGRPPVDRDALVELLLRVSRFVETAEDVRELDLNPVVARHDGLSLVDVRLVVARPPVSGDGPAGADRPSRQLATVDRGTT